MKRWILGVTVLSLSLGGLFGGATVASAEDIFRIEMGKSKSYSERELRQRIEMLERAVEQLQRKVFDLQREPEYSRPGFGKMTTCYLKTPFDGTFMATEPTETAARAITLKKCNDKLNGSSIFCKESELKCGQ